MKTLFHWCSAHIVIKSLNSAFDNHYFDLSLRAFVLRVSDQSDTNDAELNRHKMITVVVIILVQVG